MPRPSIGRLFLYGGLAAMISAASVGGVLYALLTSSPKAPEPLNYDIPAEVSCLIPASSTEELPKSITAKKPHIRLRACANNQYELLYWGNPVRAGYTYSIINVSNKQSVLLRDDGKTEPFRELQVSTPNNQKGTIVLQPIIPLRQLRGKSGEYYAAKVSIHDATDGTILCSAIYLICGNSQH